MIGDDLVAESLGLEGLRIVAQQVSHGGVDRREEVRVVVRGHPLDDAGEALQAHASVDRLHRQRHARAIGALLELHEDQVPDLKPAWAMLRMVRHAVRPFTELGSSIEMDLRAPPARAGLGHPPEVGVVALFYVAPAGDPFGRQPDLIVPDVVGLVIVAVDGGGQSIARDPKDLRQQLPGPLDRLALEVVAEAPVAEHLEEGVMARSAAHLLEIVVLAGDTEATLVVGRPYVAALLTPRQHVLELDHPRVREQQRLVPGRHKRRASYLRVAALGEEFDIAAAHLGRGKVGDRQVFHRR